MSTERREHLEIIKSDEFLRQFLLEFLEELHCYDSNADRYLRVSTDSIQIKPQVIGYLNIQSDNLNAESLYFDFCAANVDTDLKAVVVENFLASRFDVEVESLSVENLDNFRIINHLGNFRVAVIIDHPKNFIGEVIKLILFCDIYLND
jgi:hypothetical protein